MQIVWKQESHKAISISRLKWTLIVTDLYTNGHIVETENIDPSETTSGDDDHNDDTKLKLEEVVGKFIEIVQHDTSNEKDGANNDAPVESQEDNKEQQGTNQTELPNENNDEEEHDSNL